MRWMWSNFCDPRSFYEKRISLVEILTCVALIGVVMAISTPVFVQAKRRANISSSQQLMRQFHLSAKLYQADWGDGGYGDLPQMGLPPVGDNTPIMAMLPNHTIDWPSPCGTNPMWITEPVLFEFIYRPGNGGASFAEMSQIYQENQMLFLDMNCDEPGTPVKNPDFLHRGIGITLGGQSVHHLKMGQMFLDDAWWTSPPK